ncbi:hypothetical protein ACFQ2B_31045 [Streptomyces stramineus]
MTTVDATYHALLARHDAMRLRRRLLSPAQGPADAAGARPAADSYDGVADQRLIVQTLELVAPLDELIAHLYDAMFTQWPFLRSLFPESMEFQRKHLEQAFRYLIENLHRPEEVTATFTRLGRDHRKLGCGRRTSGPSRWPCARRCAARRARGGTMPWNGPGCAWCASRWPPWSRARRPRWGNRRPGRPR